MTAPGGGVPLTGGEGTPQHAAPPTQVSEKGKASGAEAMARSWWGTRGPAPGSCPGRWKLWILLMAAATRRRTVKSHSTVLPERAGLL